MSSAFQAFIAAGFIAGASGLVSYASDFEYAAPAPGSYKLPVIKKAGDGEVLDAHGNSLQLRDLTRGRVTVMSFIYTRCGDAKACPYATGVLKELHQRSTEDPALASGMRLISMSFDPEMDTPAQLAAYSAFAQSDVPAAEWRFLTTALPAKLKPILDSYGQAVNRKANASDPTGPLNHTLRVFLIDREGRIRNIYSSGTLDPRLVLADVRTLMMESPLTPEQAARKPGETCTVSFKVETAARITDITDRENPRQHELILVDARNDDTQATPIERAGIIVRVPESVLEKFGTKSLDALARRFEGRTVIITGKVEVEAHPFHHDARGESRPRPTISVVDPAQIRTD